MARVAIVGGGLTGSHTALALRLLGHRVTVVSARPPDQVRSAPAGPAHLFLGRGRARHRSPGLHGLGGLPPAIRTVSMRVVDPTGMVLCDWLGGLRTPAVALDPRLAQSHALERAIALGAEIHTRNADSAVLDMLCASHDLVIAATGTGGALTPNPVRRVVTAAYVRGGVHPSDATAVFVPHVGEVFIGPATTIGGDCQHVLIHAVPDGPLDFAGVRDSRSLWSAVRQAFRELLPREYAQVARADLVDRAAASCTPWAAPELPVARSSGGRRRILSLSHAAEPGHGFVSSADGAIAAATACAGLVRTHPGALDEAWVAAASDQIRRVAPTPGHWSDDLRERPPKLLDDYFPPQSRSTASLDV